MKLHNLLWAFIAAIILLPGCENNDEQDDLPPVIDMVASGAFPHSCDTLYPGESFVFKATFTDNVELGSYSLDIHHNFDHHNPHTGQIGECPQEPVKKPVDPYVLQRSFSIPEGSTTYEASNEIAVPVHVDTGDYHLLVKLTDATGWQTTHAVSIKIANR